MACSAFGPASDVSYSGVPC